MYIGVAQANSAWVEYRHSRFDQAVVHANEALNNWSNLAYPFTWLARLVLLAIALERGEPQTAMEQAWHMNDISQQKLPDPIYNCFEGASRPGSGTQKVGTTKTALRKAVTLANKEGYL